MGFQRTGSRIERRVLPRGHAGTSVSGRHSAGRPMYHDQTTRPLADIRWELFTLLAHGAFVTMVDKTGFMAGSIQSRMRASARRFRKRETSGRSLDSGPSMRLAST